MKLPLRWERLWWRLRYLRPIQVLQRLHLRLRPPGQLAAVDTPVWRVPPGRYLESAPMPAHCRGGDQLVLLGRELAWTAGSAWPDRVPGKKLRMELNTFNWLWSCEPALASERLEAWIEAHKVPGGPAWHPYITSQRIANWLKWSLQGEVPGASLRESLAQQLRYLEPRLQYDECDHKLINNAKALLFAGHVLEDTRSHRWRRLGLRLLSRYLPRVQHPDGGYQGRSPMYHNALLHDLLDIINLLQACGRPLPDGLRERCLAAMRWSRALCHADGRPALFNDAALDVVASTPDLTDYARRLGLLTAGADRDTPGSCWLPDSGFGRLSCGPALLLADMGPPGPDHAASHGHAGALGFEFSLGQQRVLVDTGLSTYESLAEREYERSTAAHNTLVVDAHNSSDVWGLFKLGRRAKISAAGFREQTGQARLWAAHDGYSRLQPGLLHRRDWQLEGGRLCLEDRVEGRGQHELALYFHLHPALSAELTGPDVARLALPDGRRLTLTVDQGLNLALQAGYRATHFDRRQPCTVIRASGAFCLPITLRCRLEGWSQSVPDLGHRE